MSTPTKIFFLGATGYIGSQVLTRLLSIPNTRITALTRKDDKLALINELRPGQLKGVKGELGDLELLEKLARESDVVVNTADADDVPATQALLRGLASNSKSTGTPPILIHTSGTGTIADKAAGLYPGTKIFSDLPVTSSLAPGLTPIRDLPDSAFHRDVDLEIVRADQRGEVRSYIILPSTIYGLGQGELVEKGVGNAHSIQMPAMIKASIDRGRAGMVGKGENIWPDVHVDDIADLFIKVYELAVGGDTEHHGESGYFFGESGEHTLLQAAQEIGKAMIQHKYAEEAEPATFTSDDIDKYFGGSPYLGSNSRCRADHSRQIGWSPLHEVKDFYASLWKEVEAVGAGRPEGGWKWGSRL